MKFCGNKMDELKSVNDRGTSPFLPPGTTLRSSESCEGGLSAVNMFQNYPDTSAL